MKRLSRNLSVLLMGLVIGVLVSVGASVLATKQGETGAERLLAANQVSTEQALKDSLPYQELKTFTEVFSTIKQQYVDDVSDETLLKNALQGMISGLDPHSSYLEPEGFDDLKVGTSGEFGGLGIEVTMEDGFVKVVSPIDDTPAQRAGIKAGDLIIRLDDTAVKGMELKDAVAIMRGKVGDPITLTVLREGKDQPFEVVIVRDIIKVPSVRSRILEKGYGYVRITQFQKRTGEQLQDALEKLEKENEAPLDGLILDLRNNPGGLLNAAVDVASTFLDGGLVVYTEGRIPSANKKFKARRGEKLKGVPIVIMINGGTASASEIVSGALQDRGRAVITGTKSFGKGSVQTVLPMQGGAALKLTTARYYTPSGRSIQAEGIVPDIELDDSYQISEISEDKKIEGLKEKDLVGHLENNSHDEEEPSSEDSKQKVEDDKKDKSEPAEDKTDSEEKGSDSDKAKEDEDETSKPIKPSEDFQLYESLNLLKGFHIFGKVHSGELR
ncbi:MAG: PDZ domain-containing protein [Gammaproteobacteria bacterium]|nr:MAG: PDZ domain-containing protein [Gammaproteobacteria bacterium]